MMSVALRFVGGNRAVFVACVVALTIGVTGRTARADEPDDKPDRGALLGPAAGALTALVPLAVGGAFLAHDHQPALQRTGIYVIATGFAAAPWVAHGIGGRWRRALVFGLFSLGASAGTVVAMNIQDPFDPDLANYRRLTFGTLLTTAFLASAVGVIDSFIVASEPAGRR